MDFSNERYVRLYTRDTTTWRRLGFAGQTMLMHLLRRADRAGVIDIDDMTPSEAAQLHSGAPPDLADAGVASLLRLGVVVHDEGRLVFPSYIAANESAQSDKQRQRESRERRAALANHVDMAVKATDVTIRDEMSQPVTVGHSVPCRADLNSQISENDQIQSLAADVLRADAREEADSGGDVIQIDSRLEAMRATEWVLVHTGNPCPAHNRHLAADLTWIGKRPQGELDRVAAVLAVEREKPGVQKYLKPAHLVANWTTYLAGDHPGPKLKPPTMRRNIGAAPCSSDEDHLADKALGNRVMEGW